MKINQITYTGFGGLSSVVFSLIDADKFKQHDWSIGFIGDQSIDTTYHARCITKSVIYDSFQSTPGKPYYAWLKLFSWLYKVTPDAVVCHSINSILPCYFYAKKNSIPLIAVEHTPNQVKTRSEWAASRVSMLLADRVVVLTNEYKHELKNSHGWLYREKKITEIPNGIDTQTFQPLPFRTKLTNRPIRLGMAARFSFSKRQDLLVSCLECLTKLRPDLEFELSFAGGGCEFQRVQNAATFSQVAKQIRFDGLLSEAEVAPWLQGLDIYVHATEGETLSTSLLQAMSTGLPIVASDIPGVNNLLNSDDDYGICVPNEADAFAKAILSLVDDPEWAAVLGRRARARIEAHYSCTTMLQRYLSTIETVRQKR